MKKTNNPLLFSPTTPSSTTTTSSHFFRILAISFFICILLYFITSSTLLWTNSNYYTNFLTQSSHFSPSVSLDHIVFGLASSTTSWVNHREFLKLWWDPTKMHGSVFVDALPPELVNRTQQQHGRDNINSGTPEVHVSQDTSQFPYTYMHGHRSAIRVARMVLETVRLNEEEDARGVQWYVFGYGHTVFFPENLAKTLWKYDHEKWYFIGANSESYQQNKDNSFEMAFWGGGFALSGPLARKLASVLDSCLDRYPHLYGSDSRVFACLAELGVGLTHEPGFHQVDVRGDLFGVLAAHPIKPIVSLSNMHKVEPIFPNKSVIHSLHHLFKSAKADSERILQQTVCYDHWYLWTISVSWGYAVQIFNKHLQLHDALNVQETFYPLKKGSPANYVFNTRPVNPDPCRRPTTFFLDEIQSKGMKIRTKYRRVSPGNCTSDKTVNSPKTIDEIVVFSWKSNLGINQMQAPRRQCCEILPPKVSSRLDIWIRGCRDGELINIHA